MKKIGVSARNDQSERRKQNRRIIKRNRKNVSFDVINTDERNVQPERQSLRVTHADEQGTDQTRTSGNGNCVNIFERDVGFFQRFIHNRINFFQMFPRRQLRHDTAERFVQFDLRGNYRRQNHVAVFDNRRRRFVARTFNS